jgi:hypothetical protein
MRSNAYSLRAALTLFVFSFALNLAPAWSQGAGYEQPPTFSPAQVLTPQLQRSSYHSIEGTVTNDGFINTYQMRTKFGTYTVESTDLLKVRVREVAAAVQLEQYSGTDTMLNAAGQTAMKPLKTGKNLITKPGQTVKNTFRGVGKMFGRIGAGMNKTDSQGESTIGSLTGAASAKRNLAYKFGVDPYTKFEPLRQQLSSLSAANAWGGSAVNVGFVFVTGGAGAAISIGSGSETLRATLRDSTTAELEETGRQQLAGMNVNRASIDAFYRSPSLTPAGKAVLLDALNRMRGVSNRGDFIRRVGNAKSHKVAFLVMRRAQMTATYHERVSPASSITSLGGMPMVMASNGVIGIFPIDHLSWTQGFAGTVSAVNKRAGSQRIQMLISGTASKRAAARLKKNGWLLKQRQAL